jgi:hypothetical protein
MKKVLFMIMAFSLCLVSCKNKNNQSEFPGFYNYETVMNEDIMKYQGDGIFYESQIIFDTNVCEDSAKVVYIRNIFQLGDTCLQVIHEQDGSLIEKRDLDRWMEDMRIDYMDSVGLSLTGAINSLISYDTVKFETKYCTLRRPVSREFYQNALYIFGDQEGDVFRAVDSKTGDVIEM